MYEKIKAFEIDHAGGAANAFPFSARLARENGWSRTYTLRVIEEYKRFVCLMATAAHPVTPSEAVDQVWHLHITYTRSYWDGMCKQIVGRPLHHDPTRGGSNENAKFNDWYTRTLETYRRAFGHEPPADIWPSPATRFEPSRMQWVDLTKFRLVARQPRATGRLKWLGLGGFAAATIAGCGTMRGSSREMWLVFGAFGFFALFAVVTKLIRGKKAGRDEGSGCGGGCSHAGGCGGDSGCGGDGGGGCGGGCGGGD